jgi:hypothetical protein
MLGVLLAGAPAADAAPTCTDADLATRQGYTCSLAPGEGVTPGSSCNAERGIVRWPYERHTLCRPDDAY